MRRLAILVALGALSATAALAADTKSQDPQWSLNVSTIEACSCPMFCQCYFATEPAGHHMEGMQGHEGMEHYCRFNNAYKVNKGSYGSVKLDGAKFWIYGDLGGDFSKGQMDWAVVTFDKATTPEQRDAIAKVCARLFPVKWNSLTTAEGEISWTASKDNAVALLDGGKTAEVRLDASKLQRNNSAEQMVIKNLRYWGAGRNDGFVLMPNTVEAVHVGDKQYEFKGTNGFMITFDVDSKTAPPAAGM